MNSNPGSSQSWRPQRAREYQTASRSWAQLQQRAQQQQQQQQQHHGSLHQLQVQLQHQHQPWTVHPSPQPGFNPSSTVQLRPSHHMGQQPMSAQQISTAPGAIQGRQMMPAGPPLAQIHSNMSLTGQSSRVFTDPSVDVDDDLIPTAIVIKNIPFAVKKEQLIQLMTDLQLPLPYAFNYHFDNGVFRGLAFANFSSPEETRIVIEHLNHYELHARKLRVEYKKMLPPAERERIEREKRERRGQLEEQHRPIPPVQLHSLPSHSSLSSHMTAASPSPVSRTAAFECDMNDPFVLKIYSELLILKETPGRDSVSFPANFKPEQRRTVHVLAQGFGLYHTSKGHGDQRYVLVSKTPSDPSGDHGSHVNQHQHQHTHVGTHHSGSSNNHNHNHNSASHHPHHSPAQPQRDYGRTLATAASLNVLSGSSSFGFEDRASTLSVKQASSFLGAVPGGQEYGAAPFSLRSAKSYADLRSITPSPVPSTASFPTTLQTFNGQQFNLGSKPATTNTFIPNRTEESFPSPIGFLRLGSYAASKGVDGGSQQGTMPRPIGDRYGAKNVSSAASTPSFDGTDHRLDLSLGSMSINYERGAHSTMAPRPRYSAHGQENNGNEISVE